MSTLTPERRPSTGSVTFQRRYSRAYEQPIVHHTSIGPTVRVDDDTQSESSASASDPPGKVLNPEGRRLESLLAKCGVGGLTLLGVIAGLFGQAPLLALSQLFGFVFVLLATFFACCGLYLWWGVRHHEHVQLDVKKVLILYGICTSSDILAQLLTAITQLPIPESLPLEVGCFILFGTLLLTQFAVLAHRDGLNGMFSHEASVFVVMTLLLNFSAKCTFGQILPALILPQLVFISALMGLTLSLLRHKLPRPSLSVLLWALTSHEPVPHGSLRPMRPSGKKVSSSSITSLASSRPTRNSFSSLSSMTSLLPNVHGGVDTDVVNEAHGLIGDLLLNEAFPDHTKHKLARVKELLAPKVNRQIYTAKMIIDQQVGRDDRDYESDASAPSVVSSTASVYNVTPASIPHYRHAHHSHIPRKSSVINRRTSTRFSTTTTSSGMPVLETEPLDRHRTFALRDVKARISIQQEKRNSVHLLTRERLGSTGSGLASTPTRESPLLSLSLTSSRLPESETSPLATPGRLSGSQSPVPRKSDTTAAQPTLPPDSTVGMATTGASETDRQPVAIREQLGSLGIDLDRKATTPTRESPTETAKSPTSPAHSPHDDTPLESIEEADENTAVQNTRTGTRGRSQTLPKHVKLSPFSGQLERMGTTKEADEMKSSRSDSEGDGTAVGAREAAAGEAKEEQEVRTGEVVRLSHRSSQGYSMFTNYKSPDYGYSLEEYSMSSASNILENVASWDFPIFELEEKVGTHILSQMAFVLFQEAGLMETFHIPQREFVNFFRVLEANYGNSVYHNKTHAADVLHATSYLLFEMIPEFSHEFSDNSDRIWKGHQRMKASSGGSIASAFSILEVFACYMAAAMHDYDHPGRTNAFLVATKNPLAVLYNDRSVLENHHSAASWDLLTSVPENNFLGDLIETERKRFRFLLIEAILATDLKLHFDILSEFKAKVNLEEGGGIDWNSEVDRLMVMKMIIKMADISTPTKSYDLHRSWTKRITEEFYQQNDEEVELGLQRTIFMDRRHTEKLPAIQLSFIQNLVSPLFHASAEAGIIPGVTETVPTLPRTPTPFSSQKLDDAEMVPESEGTAEEGEDARRPFWIHASSLDRESSFEVEDDTEPPQKFMSIILTNLQINYDCWQSELPKEPESEKEPEKEPEKEGDGADSPVLDTALDDSVFPEHEETTPGHSSVEVSIPEVKVEDTED